MIRNGMLDPLFLIALLVQGITASEKKSQQAKYRQVKNESRRGNPVVGEITVMNLL
jgi:hypothetical protein